MDWNQCLLSAESDKSMFVQSPDKHCILLTKHRNILLSLLFNFNAINLKQEGEIFVLCFVSLCLVFPSSLPPSLQTKSLIIRLRCTSIIKCNDHQSCSDLLFLLQRTFLSPGKIQNI